MSRFKFRAWDKAKKVMYDNHTFATISATGLGKWTGLKWMQSTGLKDKNGKIIFEGDVVRILYTDWMSKGDSDPRSLDEYKRDISLIGEVKFFSFEYGIDIKGNNYSINEGRHGEKEVIGNIHENQDLLSKGLG